MLGPAGTTSSLLINGNGSPAMERRTYNQPGEENKTQTKIVVVSSPKVTGGKRVDGATVEINELVNTRAKYQMNTKLRLSVRFRHVRKNKTKQKNSSSKDRKEKKNREKKEKEKGADRKR
ncbi:hypothetical protein DAPPUDRAFT_235547 [Daphnia pulex]|uniref:Uncharacterized protein n=1 Tax=Daphnia pulex TaxID=6669 RepID=E9G059_DAPPU|nr:hypothetical protein DAPPUDRAFT_235547 [Daphnia pulex]|eukprot:EFX86844.1 hypothetical protein DAPPUDRAFT_235547 [Daphnia pulex]